MRLSGHCIHTPGFSAKYVIYIFHQVGKVISYLYDSLLSLLSIPGTVAIIRTLPDIDGAGGISSPFSLSSLLLLWPPIV